MAVETDANGDLWSTNERVLPWLVCLACRGGTRDLYPALAALVSPVQNNFVLAACFFSLCATIAQQPGQAVVLGRLSFSWLRLGV
jgi:hypothetical protein